jgi:hypothetical protein
LLEPAKIGLREIGQLLAKGKITKHEKISEKDDKVIKNDNQ